MQFKCWEVFQHASKNKTEKTEGSVRSLQFSTYRSPRQHQLHIYIYMQECPNWFHKPRADRCIRGDRADGRKESNQASNKGIEEILRRELRRISLIPLFSFSPRPLGPSTLFFVSHRPRNYSDTFIIGTFGPNRNPWDDFNSLVPIKLNVSNLQRKHKSHDFMDYVAIKSSLQNLDNK